MEHTNTITTHSDETPIWDTLTQLPLTVTGHINIMNMEHTNTTTHSDETPIWDPTNTHNDRTTLTQSTTHSDWSYQNGTH